MSNFPWLISHKVNVFFNVFDIFNVLFCWICIVKPQIAFTFAYSSLHEIESHSFTMADVKVAVGLRWESSEDNISKFINSVLQKFF